MKKNGKIILRKAVFLCAGILLLGMTACQKEDTSFEMKDTMRFKETEENTQDQKFDLADKEGTATSTEQETEEKTEQQTTTEQKTEQQTTEQKTEEKKKENSGKDTGKDKNSEGKEKTKEKEGSNSDGDKGKSKETTAGDKGKKEPSDKDVEAPDITIDVNDDDEDGEVLD